MSSSQAPTPHSTVTSCTHTLGSHALRPASCPICLEPISRTSPTITHTGCLNAFHTPCFDALVRSSTNLLHPRPSPTKCPICRGAMPPHPVLACHPPPLAPAAEAPRPNPHAPYVNPARIREAAARTAAAAALEKQKAHAARQAQLAQQKAQLAAQQRLPSLDRIRSLIPARGILLGELMGRLVTPGMSPAVRATLQKRVLSVGRLEGATGRVMPRY